MDGHGRHSAPRAPSTILHTLSCVLHPTHPSHPPHLPNPSQHLHEIFYRGARGKTRRLPVDFGLRAMWEEPTITEVNDHEFHGVTHRGWMMPLRV